MDTTFIASIQYDDINQGINKSLLYACMDIFICLGIYVYVFGY